MSRDNQSSGLQVALIVFVILCVVLGTTCVVLFNRANEAQSRVAALSAEAEQLRAAAATERDQAAELKRIIGQPASASAEAIRTQLAADVQPLVSVLSEDRRAYRPAVAYLQDTLQTCRDDLAKSKAECEETRTRVAKAEEIKNKLIEKFRKSAEDLGQRLVQIEKAAEEVRAAAIAAQKDAEIRVKNKVAEANDKDKAAKKEIDYLKELLAKTRGDLETIREKFE